jgi:hypothetical protein
LGCRGRDPLPSKGDAVERVKRIGRADGQGSGGGSDD